MVRICVALAIQGHFHIPLCMPHAQSLIDTPMPQRPLCRIAFDVHTAHSTVHNDCNDAASMP